ncbi:MAG: DUF4864 domain-containing protein [Cognatishimia activa]|uniref:DUF4864 domain-containing protein n=1 Tax=Cognatishimia activa TaxID=1715691 RepID=A0A975I7Z7_9RHOB|nr:DUF4864 domain-containing protein [Cognatishimia activa]QTN36537.1 DUF4864 domain-containing protein [Cognatishimia activa]
MRIVYALLLSLWASVSVAQERDIQAVITQQIEAFQVDDFAQAFTYASPNIQGFFGTSERFGQMVMSGYPMVHRPDAVRYLELREIAGNLWQRVMITDPAGVIHILDYQMKMIDGMWRINGVQILPAPGDTA